VARTLGTGAAAGLAATFGGSRLPAAEPKGTIAPFTVEGEAVVVPAGVYLVPGGRVRVTEDAVLRIDPVDTADVHDEELQLGTRRPAGFFTGVRLQAVRARNIGAFRALLADSVRVRDAGGRWLKRGEDFLVSASFALVGIGTKPSVAPTDPVFASYAYTLQRIDAIAVDPEGRAHLRRGVPALATPVAPEVPAGWTEIARVYRPLGQAGRPLTEAQVFPVVASAAAARTETTGRLSTTLRKLRVGEPVKIVCWGDSITVGADVEPADAWANRLREEVARIFPGAPLAWGNRSIGGTKSVQWLHNGEYPGLPAANPQLCRFEHVLAEQPDLVVMEFLNDVVLDAPTLERTYDTIDTEFRSRGIEWLIVTPSRKIPETFELAEMKDNKPRLLDAFLREFAHRRGHSLADAAARWQHLYREGIPYFALFNNAYNHPNAFGHGLFVEEILRCFAEPGRGGRRPAP
jgi:hypothetical protein